MTVAPVTNIQRFSVHDGPGIRSTVFLKGCTMSCVWCSNPENISPLKQISYQENRCIHCGSCVTNCPVGAIMIDCVDGAVVFDRTACIRCGKCAEVCCTEACTMKGQDDSSEELVAVLMEDKQFYDQSGGGVTFSGGEPLTYSGFVSDVFRAMNNHGINTAVETCGAVPWGNIEEVLPVTDLFLYDIKMVSPDKHEQYCGRSNKEILDNLDALCKCSDQTKIIIRIPLIPEINDDEEELTKIGMLLHRYEAYISGVHCLPYHNFGISKYDALGMQYKGEDIIVPQKEYVEERVRIIQKHLKSKIQVGG